MGLVVMLGAGYVAPILLIVVGRRLTRWLGGRGQAGLVSALLGCYLVALVGLSYVVVLTITSSGDPADPNIELRNSSTDTVALWNRGDGNPDLRYAAFPLQPGKSMDVRVSASLLEGTGGCLPEPAGLVVEATNTGLVLDQATNQPTVIASFPPGQCFDGDDVRIDWNGSELLIGRDAGITVLSGITWGAGLCLAMLALGHLADRRRLKAR